MDYIYLNEDNDMFLQPENNKKKPYQRKYRCPYCNENIERDKLHIHIQNKHEELIPENYTALRIAFNQINHKTEGHCIICKNISPWNENKGRYERLCTNPKCHQEYKKMVAERNKKIYGVERLQTDERYNEFVQKKALSRRKISGVYKFQDGGAHQYVGSYEKNFLEFMDTVMHCKSEDLVEPGPGISYEFENKKHLYLPDFLYVPYQLLIEIKDGGDNPNNHPHRLEDEKKNKAKETAVKKLNKYSYVRVVNNNFSQLLTAMAMLKYNMQENNSNPIVITNENSLLESDEKSILEKNKKALQIDVPNLTNVNESAINESILINDDDLYYNKDKFDSGEINLCFIIGHSGSGKSTMLYNIKDANYQNTECYELDCLRNVKKYFTLKQLKEYGELYYSFFTGIGKKYYIDKNDLSAQGISIESYTQDLFRLFIPYAIDYAKKHRNTKFILEGVWLLTDDWFKPEDFKNYAVFIKGTSMILSKFRATKRDSKGNPIRYAKKFIQHNFSRYIIREVALHKWREYFEGLMEKNRKDLKLISVHNFTNVNESALNFTENMAGTIGAALPNEQNGKYYIIQHLQNNVFYHGLTKDPAQNTIYEVEPTADDDCYIVSKTSKNKINSDYKTFEIKNTKLAEEIYNELAMVYQSNNHIIHDKISGLSYIYSKITEGSCLYEPDQLLIDARFKLVPNPKSIQEECQNVYSYIMNKNNIVQLENQINSLEEHLNSFVAISNDYYKWMQLITGLQSRLLLEQNIKAKEKINDTIWRLGWIPDVPLTNESYKLLIDYCSKIPLYEEVDLTQDQNLSLSLHESTYQPKKMVPIFIVLTHSVKNSIRNTVEKTIQWWTKSKWEHAEIGFSSSLYELYTFNLKGFSISGIDRWISESKRNPLQIKVNVLWVTRQQRKKMREVIRFYIHNIRKTSYAIYNIINIFFSKIVFARDNELERICSQFVYTICNIGNLNLHKPSMLVRPRDLDRNKKLYKVYEGPVEQYKKYKIDIILSNIYSKLFNE